jgi:hypothetical protein
VLLMGVRLYDPGTGRFWSRDPSPGGSATAYDYCSGDPVNCTDLDGHWGMFASLVKKYAAKVARVAEIVATVVPGPIGAAAAAISAGAYAATGNKSKALERGVMTVAAMVPGGGAMVKAGFAAARAGGRVAARVGQAVAKPFKRSGCNSFTPETPVLMADGTTTPIADIDVGDLVLARDPLTGETTAQPVLDVIVGHGDKHLIGITTARASLADGGDTPGPADLDTWVATANHPIWVEGQSWTHAEKLEVGERTVDADGEPRVVTNVIDHGWAPRQTVFNPSVANIHTFVVGGKGAGSVAHNASCASASPIVIGESMGRVRAAAAKNGARTYEPDVFHTPDRALNRVKNMVNNYRWLRTEMKRGTAIIDIGRDAARSTRSPYYRLERMTLTAFRYKNVRRG